MQTAQEHVCGPSILCRVKLSQISYNHADVCLKLIPNAENGAGSGSAGEVGLEQPDPPRP